MSRRQRRRRRWPLARDAATYSLGVALAVHEALKADPKPDLLALYAAMMGLPGVFRWEERRRVEEAAESPDELRVERLRRAKEIAELEAELVAMHVELPGGYDDGDSASSPPRRWPWRRRPAPPDPAEAPVDQ